MSMDESVYAAPESALDRPVESSARSLEDAIEGNWDFDIMEVIREAWDKTSGAKGALWVGLLITYAASFVMQFVGVGVGAAVGSESALGLSLIFGLQFLGQAVAIVVTTGMYYYAIKWTAGDTSAEAKDILSAFSIAGPLIGMWLLMVALIMVGFVLLVLPAFYLMIAYILAGPLVIERGLGVWEALETSRKAITNHWFKVFGLLAIAGFAMTLGTIFTLGIGMIWAMPFFFLLYGVLYNRIFGYSGAGGAAG